jgi:hypothetical protein
MDFSFSDERTILGVSQRKTTDKRALACHARIPAAAFAPGAAQRQRNVTAGPMEPKA